MSSSAIWNTKESFNPNAWKKKATQADFLEAAASARNYHSTIENEQAAAEYWMTSLVDDDEESFVAIVGNNFFPLLMEARHALDKKQTLRICA